MTAPSALPTREVPVGLTAEQALLLSTQQTYAAQQAALRQQLAVALASVWAATTATPDFSPVAAAKFVAQILPITTGAQRAMAALTVAAFNQRIQPSRPITVPMEQVTGQALRGTPPAEVYARPFKEIKWRLSQGKSLGQAVDAGLRRANSIAESDLQLAHTHTARRYLQQATTLPAGPGYLDRAREAHQRRLDDLLSRRGTPTATRRPTPEPPPRDRGTVVGYRRVLGSNPNHCAMCLIASTQRYHIESLMPMHPGCHCTVQEVWSTDDRSDKQVLDPSFLQEIHNAIIRDLGSDYVDAGGRGPASTTNTKGDLIAGYKNIIITNQHGELGPVLGIRGHDFTGPKNIPNLGHERINPLVGDDGVPNLDNL